MNPLCRTEEELRAQRTADRLRDELTGINPFEAAMLGFASMPHNGAPLAAKDNSVQIAFDLARANRAGFSASWPNQLLIDTNGVSHESFSQDDLAKIAYELDPDFYRENPQAVMASITMFFILARAGQGDMKLDPVSA